MKILVTGAFGIVGLSVIDELKARNHEIYVFDQKNKKNKNCAKNLKNYIRKIYWGDLRDREAVQKATADCDCVIHLAAIVPPVSENSEEICFDINTAGTENVLEAIKMNSTDIPIIYISSASVIGPTQDKEPPVNTNSEVNPITFYSKSKVKAEAAVSNSGLKYCILRLASVMDSSSDYSDDMLKLLYEFPLAGRNEIVLDTDAATAIVTAAELIIDTDHINNKIFFIGGGVRNKCQITNAEMIRGMFTAMGIGMLSEECFTTDMSQYSMDWYDTEEGNRFLKYQNHTFRDYTKIIEKKTESGGFIVKYMAPKLKSTMELQSPYFTVNKKEK